MKYKNIVGGKFVYRENRFIAPVSYTHLDVYKRQEQITWCKQQIAQPENASNYEKLMEMTQNFHEL